MTPQTHRRTTKARAIAAQRSDRLAMGRLAAVAGLVALALIWASATAWARPAPDSFADLVEKLSPAVVNISTTQRVENQMSRRGPMDSPFDEFFREFFGGEGPGGMMPGNPQREVRSLGSGFVIDPSGIIVTNNHVVGEATGIQVTFVDGLTLEAEVVGVDPATDVAVIKVEHDEPLPHVEFGNSDVTRVGDWVMAIGNPFGLGGSVSAGIVSARNRDIRAGRYDDFIQTDAAINRGNSGGPLFNMDGKVVGINTVILTPTGGSVGVGFAISSALAESVVDQLQEYGEARRGWLGVQIQNVSEEIAESFGLKEPKGALVAGVSTDSPASKAQIQVGDVIQSFNGKPVESPRELSRIVAQTDIGKTVPVKIWRDGRERTLRVAVGQLDEDVLAQTPFGNSEPQRTNETELSDLGMTLGQLTAAARERYGLDDDAKGVLVLAVEADSPAAGRVRRGDVIVEVGQRKVTSPDDLESKLSARAKQGKEPVLLLVNRGGQLTFVAFKIEDAGKN